MGRPIPTADRVAKALLTCCESASCLRCVYNGDPDCGAHLMADAAHWMGKQSEAIKKLTADNRRMKRGKK